MPESADAANSRMRKRTSKQGKGMYQVDTTEYLLPSGHKPMNDSEWMTRSNLLSGQSYGTYQDRPLRLIRR